MGVYKKVRAYARTAGWHVVECDRPRAGQETALCVMQGTKAVGSFDLAAFDAKEGLVVVDASCCTDAAPSAASVSCKTNAHRRVLQAAVDEHHDLGRASEVVWLAYSRATGELSARRIAAAELLGGKAAPSPQEARRAARKAVREERGTRLGLVPKVSVEGHKGKSWLSVSAAARALNPASGSEYARLLALLEADKCELRAQKGCPRSVLCCLEADVRRLAF